MNRNYYESLKLPLDATLDEIKHAYKEAARQYHPDVNPRPGAEEIFIDIQQAYETLSDPEKRAAYNQSVGLPEKPSQSVEINYTFSRKKIRISDEPQLFYVLIELKPKVSIVDLVKPPLNLGLVVDRSTSMQGSKMDLVKANILQILKQLKEKDVVSIVVFSDSAEVVISNVREIGFNKAASLISMVQPGGGTEMLQGLECGINEVRKHISPGYINQLVIITDGHTYGDEEDCLMSAQNAANSGIGISAVGLGEKWNDEFMDRLARIGGGSSVYITEPGDLKRYRETKFHSLSRQFTENVTLDLSLDKGVKLRDAFRLSPDPFPLLSNLPISLGAVVSNPSLMVLLEFVIDQVPQNLKIFPIAKGRIMMEVISNPAPYERYNFKISLPTDNSLSNEPPDSTILQAVSLLSLYNLQEKARREVNEGDIPQATKHLQYLATHLISRSQRDLARKVLVEADHIKNKSKYSADGEKYIKYQTRALLLPAGMEKKEL